MTPDERVDTILERLLAETPTASAPGRLRRDIASATSRRRQHPLWLANLKEPPMRYRSRLSVGSPTLRLAAIVAPLALLVGIAGAAVAGASLGEEEDTPPSQPVEFTGHIVCGPEVQTGTYEVVPRTSDVPGHTEERGWAWQPYTTEMTEPRMEGDYYISYDSVNYWGGVSVGSGTWRIENDEGAWQGSYLHADGPDDTTTDWMSLLGEGAYEGLTVIWEWVYHPEGLCNWDVRGVIIEGEPPAVPEAFIGE